MTEIAPTAPPSAASVAPAVALRDRIGTMLDQLVELDRAASAVAGMRALLLSQLAALQELLREIERPRDRGIGRELDARAFRAEVATTLRIPERTAESLLARAATMTRTHPEIGDALRCGALTERKANALVDAVAGVHDAEEAAGLVSSALELAPQLTAAQFERRLQTMVERLRPETLADRRRSAVEDRRVWLMPLGDGMSELGARLPAEVAQAAFDRLTRIAIGLRQVPGECRSRDQLRTDAFGDLLTAGEIPDAPAEARGIRARVTITVPALTLLGRSHEPAMLDGYGPIDDETARELSAGSDDWMRILTHPETGVALSVGRDRYRPPRELRRFVERRDGTCRFPGCRMPAWRTEVDHTRPWQRGGETAANNLACLCVGHHKLKDGDTGWTVRQGEGGAMHWRSPAGRHHTTHPALAPPRS